MTILPWLILGGLVMLYWWHSGTYKGRALHLAEKYCREQDLQLLDQSMVIRGIWPVRRADGRLTLRRSYQFEFASTGDQRYRGVLVLVGMQLRSIELEAFKLPPPVE
jgi:hypothetical protein